MKKKPIQINGEEHLVDFPETLQELMKLTGVKTEQEALYNAAMAHHYRVTMQHIRKSKP